MFNPSQPRGHISNPGRWAPREHSSPETTLPRPPHTGMITVPDWSAAPARTRPAIGDLSDPAQQRIVTAFEAWRDADIDDFDATEHEFRAAVRDAGMRLTMFPHPSREFDFAGLAYQ